MGTQISSYRAGTKMRSENVQVYDQDQSGQDYTQLFRLSGSSCRWALIISGKREKKYCPPPPTTAYPADKTFPRGDPGPYPPPAEETLIPISHLLGGFPTAMLPGIMQLHLFLLSHFIRIAYVVTELKRGKKQTWLCSVSGGKSWIPGRASTTIQYFDGML